MKNITWAKRFGFRSKTSNILNKRRQKNRHNLVHY